MTQEELQKYWDASLIHAWRRFISVKGAMSQFTKGTGMMLHECDLLRVPPKGLPWTVDTRYFVATYLPKISERLFNYGPEHDIMLLRRLQSSKYDTRAPKSFLDPARAAEASRSRNDKKVLECERAFTVNRNRSTDWGVTKAPGYRIRRAR